MASLRVAWGFVLTALFVFVSISIFELAIGLGLAFAAGRDFSAVAQYVFVPNRITPSVAVIEQASDRVVGSIDIGVIPTQAVVSEAAKKLVAIAAGSRRLSIIDLKTAQRSGIDLDFVPQRILGSADGNLIAVTDLAGTIVFIELVRDREVSRITGISPIRDLMLGADGAFLYVAAEGLKGVGVVDIARGKLIDGISADGEITGLTRSPNGRLGYATARGRPLSVLDLSNFRLMRQLTVGSAGAKAFPTGFGGYLIIPDNAERAVSIVASASMTVVAMLKGGAGMTTVYSGWFDTMALVPSRTERLLMIYDLDRLARIGDVPLPGMPGPGAVTQEGSKLYLALEGTRQVGVVDLRRRQMKSIDIGSAPLAAIMARSFDICHN